MLSLHTQVQSQTVIITKFYLPRQNIVNPWTQTCNTDKTEINILLDLSGDMILNILYQTIISEGGGGGGGGNK